jgi:hypothetical protein
MAKHYYRTNVPLPIMVLWWVFLGVCVLLYGAYDAIFKAPERHATEQAQSQWDREHFNGWRLEQTYPTDNEVQRGLFFDKLDKHTCTTRGYPGYPACPPQQFYMDGRPQAYPPDAQESKAPHHK